MMRKKLFYIIYMPFLLLTKYRIHQDPFGISKMEESRKLFLKGNFFIHLLKHETVELRCLWTKSSNQEHLLPFEKLFRGFFHLRIKGKFFAKSVSQSYLENEVMFICQKFITPGICRKISVEDYFYPFNLHVQQIRFCFRSNARDIKFVRS